MSLSSGVVYCFISLHRSRRYLAVMLQNGMINLWEISCHTLLEFNRFHASLFFNNKINKKKEKKGAASIQYAPRIASRVVGGWFADQCRVAGVWAVLGRDWLAFRLIGDGGHCCCWCGGFCSLKEWQGMKEANEARGDGMNTTAG